MKTERELIMDALKARGRVARVKKTIARLQIKRNEAEHTEAKAEEALIAYMQESGCKAIEDGIAEVELGESWAVNVADIDAVPEQYIRTKTVREPDKVKIRNERPTGANWYVMSCKPKVTIKMKG